MSLCVVVFTLSRVTQECDFSINNAPLIIARLLKGEWQSFLSSRGVRGLRTSFTFWKVHRSPWRFAYHFLSIKPLNFLCCGKLSNASRARCSAACPALPPHLFRLNLQENDCMTCSACAYILFKCLDRLYTIQNFIIGANDLLLMQHVCLVASAREHRKFQGQLFFLRRTLSTFSADHIIHGSDWTSATGFLACEDPSISCPPANATP